MINR
ncbi:hypothetical protein VCNHCC008D_002242A, partial [Vibrio cholerae O1 str. NHCC-008D]|jgi:hypothetical protein